MNIVLQHVCVWLLFLFLFLFTASVLPTNSIPAALFVLLCLADGPRVREIVFTYRREIYLIAAALLIGLAFSHLPSKSAKGVYDFLRGAIIFFPVLYLVRHYSDRLILTLPWATSFSAIYLCVAVFMTARGSLLDWNMVRPGISTLLGHYNTYGTAAAVVCLASLVGLLCFEYGRLHRLLLVASVALGLMLAIYSGSRGSVLMLAATVLCLLFVKIPRWRWTIVAVGLLCFLMLLGLMVYSDQVGGLMSSWRRGADLTSGRLSIYTATLSATWEYAPITGFGPNTFKYLEHGQVLRKVNLIMPHSVYLESFYSLGLAGSTLLLASIVSLGLRLKKRRHFDLFLSLGAGLAVFYLLRGLVDFKLFSVHFAGAMAASYGFMLGGHETSPSVKNDTSAVSGAGCKTVFLDRDGTINVEKNYLHRVEDFEFIPGAPEAIKNLKDAGFLVIVVSNQSGIARGYFDEQAVDALHQHIQLALAAYDTSIDAFYFCPHHPDKGIGDYRTNCDCRKGSPGMLLRAAADHNIDLQQSFMVGDKLADIEAGERAGCQCVLVRTGYGDSVASEPEVSLVPKCHDLACAAKLILEKLNTNQSSHLIDD